MQNHVTASPGFIYFDKYIIPVDKIVRIEERDGASMALYLSSDGRPIFADTTLDELMGAIREATL